MRFETITMIIPVFQISQKLVDSFFATNYWLKDMEVSIIFKALKGEFISVPANTQVHLALDTGIYEAWNQALEIYYAGFFNNDEDYYLTFCGHDEVICRDFFQEALAVTHCESFDVIFGDGLVSINGRIIDLGVPQHPSIFGSSSEKSWDVCHPGMWFNAKLLFGYRFDKRYSLAADLKFFLDVFNGQQRVFKIHKPQAIININGISNSPSARLIYLREIRQLEKETGFRIIGFNRNLEFLKYLVLKSWFGPLIRKVYWSLK